MSLFDDLDAQNEVEKSPYRQPFNQGNVVVGPDGEDLSLPPNTGEANLYGGATPPASPSPRPKKNLFLELDAMEEGRGPVEGIGDGSAPSMTPRRKMIPVGSVNPFNKLDGILQPNDDIPQVRDSVADSIGLQRWRDVNDGTEIRRAQPAAKSIPEQGSEIPSWAGRNPFETGIREFATAASTATDNALAGAMRATAGQIQSNTSIAREKLAGLEASLAKAQEAGDQNEIQMFSRDIDSARKEVASLEQADQDAATGTGPLDKIRRAVRGLDQGAKEALQKGAEFFTEKAKSDREFYDTKPNDTSASAQVGRGLGSVASMTPTMVVPGGAGLAIVALQGASSSYNEAYEATREQLQKAGVTDEKTIDDASSQAGSTAATKTFPALAAYMVGGKITAAGVSALLKGATPLVKGLVGGTAAAGANVVTSAGIRTAEGEDWRPTIEGTTQDFAFGGIHGAGEYNQAKVTRQQQAQRFNENPGQTRSFPGDNSQNQQNPVENAPKPAENAPPKATDGNDWTTATDPEEASSPTPTIERNGEGNLFRGDEIEFNLTGEVDKTSLTPEEQKAKALDEAMAAENEKNQGSLFDEPKSDAKITGDNITAFHGSRSNERFSDFSESRDGFTYFTSDKKSAERYANPMGRPEKTAGVYDVSLKIQNPKIYRESNSQEFEAFTNRNITLEPGMDAAILVDKNGNPTDYAIPNSHIENIRITGSREDGMEMAAEEATANTRTINRDYKGYPKGTQVEITGKASKDPLSTEIQIRFPDGKTDSFPEAWLKKPKTAQTKPKQTLPQLLKERGRDAVNELLGEWNDAELSADGTYIMGVVDPRSSMKPERIPVREFLDWLQDKESKPSETPTEEAKQTGEISEEYDSLDKSIQVRYGQTPLGLPEYRQIARAFMSGELAPESGVHVTLKDGTEFDGVMKESQGMPWISENGSVRLSFYTPEHLESIESIRVIRSASDAIAEKLERKYGEIAYTQPETREDYERTLKDLATQIRKAREESEGGSNVIRYLQLEAQFDKVADEIQLAKNKRAYIKKYPGSYAEGIPFPTRPWQFSDAADQNYAIPKPSDFDPDPEVRKKRSAPHPGNSETLAQLKGSIQRAESDIYSKRLSGERKARLERIIERRKEQIEKGDYYENRLEAWNKENGTQETNPEERDSNTEESGKPFPTTKEEVQSQLDSLSEKRQQEAKAKKKGLEDFGEKIGGARKDTATKGGRGASKPQDDRPGWARRYELRQIVSEANSVIKDGVKSTEIDPLSKGRWVVVDLRNLDWRKQPKQVGRDSYATKEEAEKIVPLIAVARNHSARMVSKGEEKPVFQIWRKVTDRKLVQVVKEDFPTREAAMEYMAKNAKDIIEAKTAWREELIVKPENAVRTGTERRQGPATPEMFQDTFGFRGVEFGNWMKQDTGSRERQEVLNNAFDGLKDLAEILGVPDKALSLNGDLGLAFGARGQGLVGAKAHYEPDYGVINLTKMSGAGSLAHEWFHAFDHYLARLDSKASGSREANDTGDLIYKTRGYVSEGFSGKSQVRPEVMEAFNSLIKTMRIKAVNFVEDSKKAEDFVESTKKRLADKLVELRRNLESTLQYGSKKAPATAKQLAKFDELAGKLLDGDVKTSLRFEKDAKVKKSAKVSGMRWSNDTLDALSDLWKEVRGRSGFKSDNSGVINGLYSYVKNYAERIEMLRSASQEEVKTKAVPTDYRMESAKIDQGSATDYWQTELELAARAFSSYVEDKIANGGARSEFLSYGSDNELPGYKMWGLKPFPEGEERLATNAAMDRLFRTLKTKETEKGVSFFSRKENQKADRSGIETTLRIQKRLAQEFGGKLPTNVEVVHEPDANWNAKIENGKIQVNSAYLSPREAVYELYEELLHAAWGEKGARPAFEELWKSLPTGSRERISDLVERLYGDHPEDIRNEETRVKAVKEILKEMRDPKNKGAWERFVQTIKEIWERITGTKAENPEEIAARLLAIGKAKIEGMEDTRYSIKKAIGHAQKNAELAKDVMRKARELAKAGEDAEGHFFSEFWSEMLKKGGMNFSPTTANILKAVRKGLPDVLEWLKQNPQYQNYYHKDWELTKALLKRAFPDLTDDDFVGFRIMTGLCSPSTKLAGNMKDAVQILKLWKDTGTLKSMQWEWSPKGNRMAKAGNPFPLEANTGPLKIFSLHAVEDLYQRLGSWEKVNDYLHESVTSKELNAFNREVGYKGDVGGIGKIRKVVMEATGQDQLIPRMFVFGSKVGAYTLNTTGDDRFTTTDIWEARYVRSHFPEMFKSGTGLPVNMDEHQLFQNFSRVFGEQFKKATGLDLPPSALQAIRWFYMIDSAKKSGYSHAKTDQSISGYTDAAIRQKIGDFYGSDPQGGRSSNGTGEAGDKESKSKRVRHSLRDKEDDGFYSQLQRTLEARMPNRASVDQIRAIIDPSKGSGVKPDEIKWSNLEGFLEGKGSVTKAEVLEYLQHEGAVKFEERTLSKPNVGPWGVSNYFGDRPTEPKYAQYALPGGENYREVILTMPGADGLRLKQGLEVAQMENGKWNIRETNKSVNPWVYRQGSDSKQEILGRASDDEMLAASNQDVYRSSHFPSIPNYVAHMRLDERQDSTGADGLFIEEIQSDRHQQGRKKGYRGDFDLKRFQELGTKFDRGEASQTELAELDSLATQQRRGDSDKTPDAPFRKDWSVQMFKRALRDAIASGKEWIGWTDGETQAGRYDLSKKISKVELLNAADGKYQVTAFGLNGEQVINNENISADKLSDTIGKDLSDKLIQDLNSQPDPIMAFAEATGQDLKIGGEGMKGFYDQILPKEIGKYVKKWGGKVEEGSVYAGTSAERQEWRGAGNDFWETEDQNDAIKALEKGQKVFEFSPNGKKWEILNTNEIGSRGGASWEIHDKATKSTPIWKVAITPEMRESVQAEGQARFSIRNKDRLLAAMAQHQAAPPLSMREKVASSMRRIKGVTKDLPEFGDFKKEVLKWSARSQRSANEILRVQGQIEEAVPSKEKRDGITNWIQANGDQGLLRSWANATKNKVLKAGYEAALTLTPEEIATAKKIKDSYDILHNRAKKFGIDMGYLPNYVTELWKQEPQRAAGSSPKRLSEFFKFSQERVFPNYFEGEQAGYEPQTKDISKLLGLYMNEMNNAINSRRFVQELSKGTASDGRPLVSARGSGQEVGEDVGDKVHLVYPDKAAEGTEDYKKLDQPALHGWVFAGKDADENMILVKGDLAVHPEIATSFKNALGSSKIRQWWNEKTANPFLNATKGTAKFILDDLQGAVKGTMLSFSPFHQVQEGIHALGHRINPFGNIPKIDLRRPDQNDAVEHGLMLSHDRLSQHLFMEGVGTNNRNLVTALIRKVGFKPGRLAADRIDAYQDWLFGHYIPGLKFKTYEHILERNMERYAKDLASGKATPSQVKLLSARQANAAYGHLNYTDMGHNPTIRHAFQVVLLAPDFLEARARFTGQAIKGLAGGKVGSEQLQALAFLAVTQFVLARIMNKLENDDYEWSHPFEVKVGNKLYGLRSVPEDIYKLFGNTAGFIGGRISPIFGRLIQEGLFGVNYRGEHTTWGDALKDIVAGIVPMPFQFLTKNLTPGGRATAISPMEQILSATGLQVHRYSPISATYQLARKWTDANDPDDAKARGRYPVSKYQGLRYALEDGDFQAAKVEMRKLQAKGQKLQDIREGFKTSVDHPFTGTKLNDIRFERSLAGHDKEIFKAAVERRRIIIQRFGQALR